MNKYLIVGDVHGKIPQLCQILENSRNPAIILGDVGFEKEHNMFDIYNKNRDNKHKILFGNHDHYPFLSKLYSLGDFGRLHETDIYFIRGAYSIDASQRKEGIDWWEEEQLSIEQGYHCLADYEIWEPEIVLSHSAPQSIVESLGFKSYKTRTQQLLQCCFETHQPKIWIFGHFHRNMTIHVNGTTFICLDELQTMNLYL